MDLNEAVLTTLTETYGRTIKAELNIETLQKRDAEKDDLIQKLTERIVALENLAGAPTQISVEDTNETEKVPTTRTVAITSLAAKLKQAGLEVSIKGHGNRGSNKLRIVEKDGTEHAFYLAASRNYFDSSDNFSAWHTPRPEDVDSERYESFVLSAEDETGNALFFILTSEEMKEIVRDRQINGGFYHFYIGRSHGDSNTFVDHRGSEETDFTPYYSAWGSLIR
ncbi:hypothetical protein CQ017_04535 [Arthrobacter sp. MYb224]|uniref:hypothetical protein n=1 Tax=Arthrobacter sp. MYb224 TaxID=1848600 RepID=UPI000CFC7D7D|nr:hypothetical protein [Arthrobacter sp. MYb224]PRA00303.1 hypothetical protein CQ017_04535 [Arthrobacter sp. MYb224]